MANSTDPHARASADTVWPIVWVAFAAGIIAATHIGKLPPALTAVRADLGAGLVTAGWIASTISATGFLLGLIGGSLSDRLGPRRVLVFGLAMLVVGSVIGSAAPNASVMLLARFIEGVGFTACTVTGGIIIARATSDRDRKWALAVWASFMPLGFSSMMMVSALTLDLLGWRAIWLVSAAFSAVWLVVVVRVMARWDGGGGRAGSFRVMFGNLGQSLARAGGLLAAACYGLYTTQHIGMMNWLPTYMTEVQGAGVVLASAVAAIVLLCNAGGNYTAAYAMGRGTPIWLLLALGAVGMAAAVASVFWAPIPDGFRLAALVLFGVAGGLVPAAALAAAPVFAPSAALVGAMSGLMVMGSNTGQLFGPPLLAASRAATGGWEGTAVILVGLAGVALLAALATRPFETRVTKR